VNSAGERAYNHSRRAARQQAPTMQTPRVIDFNDLPAADAQRLVASTKQRAHPRALVAEVNQPVSRGRWIVGLLVIGAAIVGRMAVGAGGTEDEKFVAVFATPAAIALGLLLVLWAIRVRAARAALPFTPGRYLFPTFVVDARSRTLRLVPMSALSDVHVAHHPLDSVYPYTDITLTFEGDISEVFSTKGRPAADAIVRDLHASQIAVREARRDHDRKVIEELDIFFNLREMRMWDGLSQVPPKKEAQLGAHRVRDLPLPRPVAGILSLTAALTAATMYALTAAMVYVTS